MATRKLLFFDIDGTLVGFDGTISDSTWKALNLARKNGHLLFLCTGRSYHQIYQALLDYGFDGIVGSAGAYVEYKDQVLFQQFFGEKHIRQIFDCFQDTGTSLIFEMRDYCASSRQSEENFLRLLQRSIQLTDLKELPAFSKLITDEAIFSHPDKYAITQSMLYCNSPYRTEELRSRLPAEIHVETASFKDPDPYSGEITLSACSKQTGMQKILDHLGKSRQDVICFGDGANDIEMLEFSGLAVVMGNAENRIKQYADYVTDPVEANGLIHAMKKLSLI